MIYLALGWLLGGVIAVIIIFAFFVVGLHGVRMEQRKNGLVDPTKKESNFWW